VAARLPVPFPSVHNVPCCCCNHRIPVGKVWGIRREGFCYCHEFRLQQFYFPDEFCDHCIVRMLSGRAIKACGSFESFRCYPAFTRRSGLVSGPDRHNLRLLTELQSLFRKERAPTVNILRGTRERCRIFGPATCIFIRYEDEPHRLYENCSYPPSHHPFRARLRVQ